MAFEQFNSGKFIAELQGGSGAAFDQLANQLFEPLWLFFVKRKFIPEADSEELAQDVLMKVHSKIHTYKKAGSAKLTTWILQIAVNCANDFHRADREAHEEFDENAEIRADGKLAGRNREYLDWLKGELEQLTADDRRILMWRENGRPHAEIGGWLGIKAGTVRVRHLRAMKRLVAAGNEAEIRGVFSGRTPEEPGAQHE